MILFPYYWVNHGESPSGEFVSVFSGSWTANPAFPTGRVTEERTGDPDLHGAFRTEVEIIHEAKEAFLGRTLDMSSLPPSLKRFDNPSLKR